LASSWAERAIEIDKVADKKALEVDHVSHSFGRLVALDDVSLSVDQGRFLALLGVNGAGKTTLFSLITRLYDNVTGAIRVDGYDVRRQPEPALARLGVLFQSIALDRDLTVRQNLAYHAALHGLPRSLARKTAEIMIEQVGLTGKMDSRVSTLSGGQMRRADIARALLHRPRLLLLDEPTVGLDVQSRLEVNALLRELAGREGVAVVWATHLLDEVQPGDQVAILHHGRIRRSGVAADIAGEASLEDAFLKLTSSTPEPAT